MMMIEVGYVILDSKNLFVHRDHHTDEPWHFSKLSTGSNYQAFWRSKEEAEEYCESNSSSGGNNWTIKPLFLGV